MTILAPRSKHARRFRGSWAKACSRRLAAEGGRCLRFKYGWDLISLNALVWVVCGVGLSGLIGWFDWFGELLLRVYGRFEAMEAFFLPSEVWFEAAGQWVFIEKGRHFIQARLAVQSCLFWNSCVQPGVQRVSNPFVYLHTFVHVKRSEPPKKTPQSDPVRAKLLARLNEREPAYAPMDA